jgi:O-antigen/teichoic acid export membrane protein
MSASDRYVLGRFVSLHEVGVYSTGSSLGQGMKLFLSSFEQAWAPFYFGVMSEPDAKATLARVTTYAVLILGLLSAGLAACARDVVTVALPAPFHPAARIVPWIGLGVALQGVYLLTSIGLNITKHTEYYPMATGIAATASVVANLLLIPPYGIVGAAWANTLGYGVLALVSWRFSQRFYPIEYEVGRLVRIVAAAGAALVVSRVVVPGFPPLVALIAHAATVLAVYAGILLASGFLAPQEIEHLVTAQRRIRRRRVIELPADVTELAGDVATSTPTDTAEVVEER